MNKREYESFTVTQQDVDDYTMCCSCGHHFLLNEEALMSDGGHIYCSPECIAEDEQNQAEAANERFIERYYGGDTPVTQQEQYEQAWKEKRKLDSSWSDYYMKMHGIADAD